MNTAIIDSAYVQAVKVARSERMARRITAPAYKAARNAIDRADAMFTEGLITERVAVQRMNAAVREARALIAS